ncbi:MAG: glycosyltransferase [Nitritalea sp.]
MRIVINTAHQRFGGAIQVALSFIHECIKFPQHEYHVWLGSGVESNLDKEIFPSNFFFYSFDFGVIKFSMIRKIQKSLRSTERKICPDVMISTSGPSYYHSICPQIVGFNLPLYIYPESPFLQTLPLSKKIKLFIKKKFHFYYFKRDASAYLVQTDDVNCRVRNILGTKNVYTVTNNHSSFYLENNLEHFSKLPSKAENEFRFLTVTSYYSHKNIEIINQIAHILHQRGIDNIKFVLTLNDGVFRNIFSSVVNVVNVGPVRPQECPSLYQECDAMFLPTLAECFSAAYPEAMIMRKPIVTTDLGFAKSICGHAALYFAPMDPYEAISKIIELVSSSDLQARLIDKGLKELKKFDTPKQRAQKYLEFVHNFHVNS